MTFFEEFYVDFTVKDIDSKIFGVKGQRLQMMLHPKEDIQLKSIDIIVKNEYLTSDKIFCNGYQSWSESREFSVNERIPALRKIGRPLKYWMGDEHFKAIVRKKGWLHSWTYSYIRTAQKFSFIGSLSDKTAFLLIQHDISSNQFHLQPDCEGLTLQHSFPVLDIVLLEGEESKCFDVYFSLVEIKKPTAKPSIGWTSWYYHYTDISEKIILENLSTWKKVQDEKTIINPNPPRQVFQIDDGWQTAIGDWLSISDAFPNGMEHIANKIKEEGYTPGLWLAPFVADTRSKIFKNHKDWLVKGTNGKPLRIGYTPLWKGGFYALDFYNKGVQDFLTKVFLTVTKKWGFALLKLDFLYAVCIQPSSSRTRGQIMHQSLSFIRDLVGDASILGCGVPLSSAFGIMDYCRIGADIHLEWEHKLLRFLNDRERVSTLISLRSTLGRWQLNQRAFLNDPDVFILRNDKNKLTPTQQYTILIINTLLGNLVFTSDDLKDYNIEQLEEYYIVEKWLNSEIKAVNQMENNKYSISFFNGGKSFIAFCNLSTQKEIFNFKNKKIELLPFESLVLKSDNK